MMSYRNDPVYQAVAWLRGDVSGADTFATAFGRVWQSWAQVEPCDVRVRLGLVNYKPFERARIVADVTLKPGSVAAEPVTLNLVLHAAVDRAAAQAELERERHCDTVTTYGPPAVLLSCHPIIVWILPNGPRLHALGEVLTPNGAGELLNEIQTPILVRYVPAKRALLTCSRSSSSEQLYIKLQPPEQAGRVARNFATAYDLARRDGSGFVAPRVTAYSERLGAVAMTALSGQVLTSQLPSAPPVTFRAVGRALAGLHGGGADLDVVWTATAEHTGLARHMAGISRALPALAPRFDQLVRHLANMPKAAAAVPIHGNLFGDQILVHPANGSAAPSVGIVDWDSLAIGDPHFDLGRLIAHFLYVARLGGMNSQDLQTGVAALLTGYAEGGGIPLHSRTLAWHIAVAALLRAKISSVRPLCPGWPDHVALMVDEAEDVLAGAGTLALVLGLTPGERILEA